MPASSHLDRFDLDIVLRDASCDMNLQPMRRAIAALCIGVSVDDAYLSVRELREAVSLVHENAPGGRAKLAGILSTQCDDFQRAIYYCLAGRGVVEMADAMESFSPEDRNLALLAVAAKLVLENLVLHVQLLRRHGLPVSDSVDALLQRLKGGKP